MNKEIAGEEAKVSEAEVNAAKEGLERRKIRSPLNGMVVEVYRHEGEWVQPEDPVVHIIRLDRLRVEGFLKVADLTPEKVDGRPVRVTVELDQGRRVTVEGKVVFADPVFAADGEFQVWAEVDNRRNPQTDKWLLGPGLLAEMTIQLK